MKRLISFGLSLALVLSLGCPTLADELAAEDIPPIVTEAPAPEETPALVEPPAPEETPGSEETPAPEETPGSEETPVPEESGPEGTPAPEETPEPAEAPSDGAVIHVEAPTFSTVVVNPYRMAVNLGGVESHDPIVSKAEALRNYSEFPVRVAVSAVGTAPPGSSAVFVQQPPAADAAAKEVFMYLEFLDAGSPDEQPSWSSCFQDSGNQVLVNGPAKEGVLTLRAGTEEAPGYGLFRLFGVVAAAPAELWAAGDTVDVKVSFTFTEEAPQD